MKDIIKKTIESTKIYNIYCDESSVDNPKSRFIVIGSLFIDRKKVPELRKNIKKIRNKYHIQSELKWSKTSSLTLTFYKELFDYLFSLSPSYFSYKCIVVDKSKVDYKKYHKEDEELAFYKFYYFLLKNSLDLDKRYYIFLDFKPSRNKNRVRRLGEFLSFTSNVGAINHIQSYPSKENIFIQISDIFTGAVAFSKNKIGVSKHKKELARIIASSIGKKDLDFCSPLTEKRFNIFCIILGENR